MSLFNFSVEELLTFFMVLIRFSVLFSVLPFIGDKLIPAPIKVLAGLVVSMALFPSLVRSGEVVPGQAVLWENSVGGIIGTVALESIFGLALGFSAKLVFDGISFGTNLIGNFMGFAIASSYDAHQEAQTAVVAQIQMAIAMLIFLALDGHHLMIRAALSSYKVVGLGKASLGKEFSQKLIQMTGDTFRFAIQITAPVAISIFSVNICFGIVSKAMPQLNVFVLSFAVSALIGMLVMLICVPEMQGAIANILLKMSDGMETIMFAMRGGR